MPSPTLSQLMSAGYFRPRASITRQGLYGGRVGYGATSETEGNRYQSPGSGYFRSTALPTYGAGSDANRLSYTPEGFRYTAPGVRDAGAPQSAGQPGGADISPLSWYGSDAEQRLLDSVNKEDFEERWDAATLEKEQALLAKMRERENAGAKQNDSSSSQTLPQFVRRAPTAPASGPGAFARGEGPFYQGGAFSGAHSAGMSFLQNWLNNSFGAGSVGYGGKSPADPSNKGKGLTSTGGEGWGEGSGIGGASGEAAFEAMLNRRLGRSGGGTGAAGGRGYSGRKSLPKRF